jgi:hypothetical protein
MINPKYEKYVKALGELQKEADKILKGARTAGGQSYLVNEHERISWQVRVDNLMHIIFGETSIQYGTLRKILDDKMSGPTRVLAIFGVIDGSLRDLEAGFLQNNEALITAQIFDSLLEEATYLNTHKFKDVAAVLCRVVLEDTLKKIARDNKIDETQKASKINDDLKTANLINQPQWRQNQAWLDIGNAAAHGDFSEYAEDNVRHMIEGITAFISAELK